MHLKHSVYGKFICFKKSDFFVEFICYNGNFTLTKDETLELVCNINNNFLNIAPFRFGPVYAAQINNGQLSLYINKSKQNVKISLLTRIDFNDVKQLVQAIKKEVN